MCQVKRARGGLWKGVECGHLIGRLRGPGPLFWAPRRCWVGLLPCLCPFTFPQASLPLPLHLPPRYLGELAKFRLTEPGPLFLRLKALLDDFAGANIDMACALVESAGRFLIRCPGEV